MGLEAPELDQLVHVLAIATVMLALMAIGLYGGDVSRHAEQDIPSPPRAEGLVGSPDRDAVFRAMVRDLR